MATTIAKHYADELVDWSRTIAFYNQEAVEFGIKLAEVIQRNSIPHIAERVEEQQDKLDAVMNKLNGLHIQMQQQETLLKTDSTFIDDTLINTETEKKQSELRLRMLKAEKEYIDTKYACTDFLSGTLKK